MRLYLNKVGSMELDDGFGIIKVIPRAYCTARYDNNKFSLDRGVLKPTSLVDIKKEDGSDYTSLNEIRYVIQSWIVKSVFNYVEPVEYIYYSQRRDGVNLLDNVSGGVGGSVFGMTSVFNGVNSSVFDFEAFDFVVGSFIELNIDLSKVNSVGYFLSSSSAEGIRYNGSNILIISNGQFSTIPFVTSSSSDKIRFERINLSTFRIYVNNTLLGDIVNDAFNMLRLNTIGARADNVHYFNGSIWDINFNNELLIPLPHLGYGFSKNGDIVNLVANNVIADYIADGSKYLLEKGFVSRGGEIIPNKPNGDTVYLYQLGDVLYKSDFITSILSRIRINNALFDRSNPLVWNDHCRALDDYDSLDSNSWDIEVLLKYKDFVLPEYLHRFIIESSNTELFSIKITK